MLWANNVSGVHDVGSSGQILPLVLGLVQLLWLGVSMVRVGSVRLLSSVPFRRLIVVQNAATIHDLEHLRKGIGFQDSSGKWL